MRLWTLVLFALSLQLSSHAEARLCSSAHRKINAPKLASFPADLTKKWDTQLADLSKNYEDGIGTRRFLGADVPNNPTTFLLALKHSLIWWRTRIYLKPTIEEAIAHRRQIRAHYESEKAVPTDLTIEAIYIIGHEGELGVSFPEGSGPGTAVNVNPTRVAPLLERGAYSINENGDVEAIASDRLKRYVKPENFFLLKMDTRPDAAGSNGLTQEGWVAFNMHGIVDQARWKNSDSGKKVQKLMTKLLSQGYTIRFNYDYDACMQMVLNQQRSYKNEKGERIRSGGGNRYSNPQMVETTLALLHAGLGYSVEVYNPQGVLVGGEIGFRHGNHFVGDTVFYSVDYNRKDHGIDGVELAKVGTAAFVDALAAQGQLYSDPGMVTPYSASTGGYLVPTPEYRQKIKSGPATEIVLPYSWDNRGADYWQRHFGDMAKRRNQGLGPNLVIKNAIPDEIRQVEHAKGLQLKTLRLVTVDSVEEAQTKLGDLLKDDPMMPFFVVRPQGSHETSLQELLKTATVVTFRNPKYLQDVITIDRERLEQAVNPNGSDRIPVWVIEK